MIPEPSLTPPEQPSAPLRCCLCLRCVSTILELPYGPVCRICLADLVLHHPLDDMAAVLCVPITEEELS